MSRVIEKPSWWSRFLHLFVGFDGPLAFAVFMLACAGLIIMFSSGYDHGTRFACTKRLSSNAKNATRTLLLK